LTWQPDPITSSPGDVAKPNFHIIRDSTRLAAASLNAEWGDVVRDLSAIWIAATVTFWLT
jgi:hypothetical protein